MKEKTTGGGAKRRKYTASFKEEVLRMVAYGRSTGEVAHTGTGYWREFSSPVEKPPQKQLKNTSTGCLNDNSGFRALNQFISKMESNA